MIFEELQRRSLKQRQIYVWGDIDDELTYEVVHQMSFLAQQNDKPIYLLIHSPGGDLDCEAAIVDEMIAAKDVGIQVWTVALGIAYSAAASILAMGTKNCRFARPNASIMLHPCSINLQKDYEAYQKAEMDYLNKRIEIFNKRIAKACGMEKKFNKFLKDIDKGLWLTPEEAIKYKVIDYIWNKPIPFGGMK